MATCFPQNKTKYEQVRLSLISTFFETAPNINAVSDLRKNADMANIHEDGGPHTPGPGPSPPMAMRGIDDFSSGGHRVDRRVKYTTGEIRKADGGVIRRRRIRLGTRIWHNIPDALEIGIHPL